MPYEDLPFSTTFYFLSGSFGGGAGLAVAALAAVAGAVAPGIALTFLTPTAPPLLGCRVSAGRPVEGDGDRVDVR